MASLPTRASGRVLRERFVEFQAFEIAEFEGRLQRAQAHMRMQELDALLVTAPANFRYFSGFDTQFWESPTRPWFLVLPGDGAAIAVVPEIGVPVLQAGWIKDIRSWPAPRPEDDGVSLLAGVLQSLRPRFGRIGLEMGRESVIRMPMTDLLKLRERLSPLQLVDGSPCIWRTRMIKSAAEVSYIRQICTVASDAFEAVPAQLAVGCTESEICRDLTIDLLRRGAHAVPFMAAASGQGGYAQIISRPKPRLLQAGDVLIIDVGATLHGYFCDFDRNFGIGPVSDAALRAHEAVWLATEAGIAAAVPGAMASDLWSAMLKVLERHGMRGNNVGRMGHGLGLQLTEPPSNMANDHTVLQPGMVVTIEPGMEYEEGRMIVHEENLVITSDGAELLTRRAPREMPVVYGATG